MNDAHFEKAAGFSFEGEREHAAATSLRWGREATGIFCFFNSALLRGCGVFVFVFVCDGQMATTALPPPHAASSASCTTTRATSARLQYASVTSLSRGEGASYRAATTTWRWLVRSAPPLDQHQLGPSSLKQQIYRITNLAQTALQALRALSQRSRLAEAVTNTCRHTASFRPIPVVAVAGERVSGANFAVSSFALALAFA